MTRGDYGWFWVTILLVVVFVALAVPAMWRWEARVKAHELIRELQAAENKW